MYKSVRVGSSSSAVHVVGVFSSRPALPRGLDVPAAAKRELTAALKTPGFKVDAGETTVTAGGHVLIGLGAKDDLDLKTIRTTGARLVKQLDQTGATVVKLHIGAGVPKRVGTAEQIGQALAEGIALANWRVDFFDGTATKNEAPTAALRIDSLDSDVKKGFKRGLTIAECANYTRQLAATPPNICNPTWMASEARRMARKAGIKCTVIDHRRAEEMGMGGIVNVGRASKNKPCLICLEYKPERAKKGVKLALVGKTITYDTGGYSLKISNGMKGMKYDKNGGMAVLGAMRAIAALKLPIHVVALLPTAENMVNGEAYRPDDIITMYNGVTVEVTNTDAEGRLVLADALAYACRKLKPTAIIDMATLTGGVVVALGSWSAGVFCNDDELLQRVETAADATDERVWRLPLWKDHCDFMRARHADIWNSGPKRDGHPIQGAAFLDFFVDDDVPWAHIDIAGVSAVDSDTDLFVQGPTGYGVRLAAEIAARYTK